MSTRETIIRYHLIINHLRKSSASLRDIQDYLQEQSALQDYKLTTSSRTFKLDLEDIASIYGIEINYDFSDKVYFIALEEGDETKKRIMEAFDLIDTFSINNSISEQVYFEKRRPQGTEHLCRLLQAIRNHLVIQFNYLKYWEATHTNRQVEPYALKEYKHRWYLLVKEIESKQVKTFALDRISDLTLSSKVFQQTAFDVDTYFNEAFGIYNTKNSHTERIILSFTPLQGKYIKSLPLHSSQRTIIDDEKEVRIELRVAMSYDLLQEILSHGHRVTVIAPKSLQEDVKQECLEMIKQYEHSL